MNEILSDPDDDTKGFFDPNTQENLTYLQLVERCVTDPITGLSLLVIVKKGELYFFVDEATKLILKSTTTTKAGGKYQRTTVSLWDLLYSKYITEEKRRELVQQYKSGSITIEHFLKIILTIIEPQTTTTSSSSIVMCQPPATQVDSSTQSTITTTVTETTEVQHFHGIRKDVTAIELLKSQIINEDLYNSLTAGNVHSDRTQIATGGIIDPVHSHRVPVQVAYTRGYFDEEMNQILSDPDDDTKGFFDPNTQENLTYLQLVERNEPDPVLTLMMTTKGFFDPNTQEEPHISSAGGEVVSQIPLQALAYW
ncbi:hypothetical protein KUCAC02_011415 [Chaenocephalus aceratus]|uniref:Uncharacterized protein n=1 Tax=Chaenocephalus aceratus TaxID=36190 RepID=A0ACB9WWK7_CHAAC|nr:hypothetical protein KUCAC02_011415 [Chaenocephalus aceratus]